MTKQEKENVMKTIAERDAMSGAATMIAMNRARIDERKRCADAVQGLKHKYSGRVIEMTSLGLMFSPEAIAIAKTYVKALQEAEDLIRTGSPP